MWSVMWSPKVKQDKHTLPKWNIHSDLLQVSVDLYMYWFGLDWVLFQRYTPKRLNVVCQSCGPGRPR